MYRIRFDREDANFIKSWESDVAENVKFDNEDNLIEFTLKNGVTVTVNAAYWDAKADLQSITILDLYNKNNTEAKIVTERPA